MKRYIPKFLKYPLTIIYVFIRCLLRGIPTKEIRLNLAGVLPAPESREIIHGGKPKLLPLREKFGDTWRNFNVAYFVSSGLPFAPGIWIKIYKLFGIKIVWNQNGFAYPALYSPKIVSRVNNLYKPINLCDFIVYQTEFTKHCTEKFIGKLNTPSKILVNPVDTRKFHPRQTPLPSKPFIIIMAGNHFESRERMTVSIEAVREVRRRGIETKLIVIGQTEYCPEESWVEKKGSYTQNEAPGLYQSAHMLLHLKYLDPCPTVILEALSSGLPVVGQANGGMPELINDRSGILIPVKEDFEKLHYPSIGEVAEAILKVHKALNEYSKNAREGVLEFDKKNWLNEHEKIFHELLK